MVFCGLLVECCTRQLFSVAYCIDSVGNMSFVLGCVEFVVLVEDFVTCTGFEWSCVLCVVFVEKLCRLV